MYMTRKERQRQRRLKLFLAFLLVTLFIILAYVNLTLTEQIVNYGVHCVDTKFLINEKELRGDRAVFWFKEERPTCSQCGCPIKKIHYYAVVLTNDLSRYYALGYSHQPGGLGRGLAVVARKMGLPVDSN